MFIAMKSMAMESIMNDISINFITAGIYEKDLPDKDRYFLIPAGEQA